MKWLILICLFVSGCCTTRAVDTKNDISIKCWDGPPCHCFLYDGDEVRDEARGPNKCKTEHHEGVP